MNTIDLETKKINNVIETLNKHGFRIPLLVPWIEFVKNKYPQFQNNRPYRIQKMIGKEAINQLKTEYIYLINDHVRNILNNIDVEKAKNIIIKEQAKEYSFVDIFINNGFIMYVKRRVFEIDMSKPIEVLMYKLIFEWYDLSEEKRDIYRSLANMCYERTDKNCGGSSMPKINLECPDFDNGSDD
ncbi:hypothetical protein NGRA_0064 [Nosema granulosis]|uniref:Uncharacterized protein n=1 Tax=Nosema granulosis TaxID=83296 RepID=A0A9P6L0P1_9MICR|nr:hypothetical protein NGRA_0064 [Nosema granulosis]